MIHALISNIKDFYDMTVFVVMLLIGLFALLSDYPYFKKQKYAGDAGITLGIGILYLILPFVFLIVSKL